MLSSKFKTPARTKSWKNPPFVLTYSALAAFLNCRKAFQLRYLEELVPLEYGAQLGFGSLMHDCLERWHRGDGLDAVLAHVNATYPAPHQSERTLKEWHLARAMMKSYAKRYPSERFEVKALEQEFLVPIRNPATGRSARKVVLAGKIDGIVKMEGRYWLLEHKTASQVTGDYIDRLPLDLQIHLYALAAERAWGIPVAGVIYNVLLKAQLKQAEGETEAQFEERRSALIAKSKTGKSSAKRQMPESDEDYQARLLKKYEEPGMFVRQELLICRDQLASLEADLWALCQEVLRAKRERRFTRNPDQCFRKDRRCAYVPLCRAGESAVVRDNWFKREAPHSELSIVKPQPEPASEPAAAGF